MEISFSQSFLDDLGRIDNKVVIDKFAIDQGELQDGLHLVCHDKKIQVCVEGISGECGRLDFYYSGVIGFTITGEGIVMNPERTIFEFNLPTEPKAIIECPGITEDTKFLEGIGTNLGNSLYKDIPVSNDSLVWKETIGKYIVDRGIQDNHSYDVELFDTKSGVLEERSIKFKSYQNIQIEQGNWEVEMIKKSVPVKHDVYADITESSFLVWDSPMIDAKVNLDEEPECLDKIGEYVDPGNIIYGNTDCFQFINYNSSLVGFKITGTEGSRVEVLFNRESSSGGFTTFDGTIGEDGTVEIRFSDLPYYHLNGIRAVGPSKVIGIETIMYLEEVVDEYTPNPDKTYVAKVRNTECYIDINGVCDYIEYEKYLGEIHEIGRGTESIDSVPGLMIKPISNEGLNYEVLGPEKQILVKQNSVRGAEIYYTIFQVTIDNNIEVNGNVITTSSLFADYKIKIEQTGIIWKIYESPDYINGDDGNGIFLLDHSSGSQRHITLMTNSQRIPAINVVLHGDGFLYFRVTAVSYGTEIIDGERWTVLGYYIETLSDNTGNSWRPKKFGTNDPELIDFYGVGESTPYISIYAIQLREIENPIKVWEETIIPGKFTEVEDSKITLQNSTTATFIVAKTGGEDVRSLNWYYYDLSGTNQFYITDYSYQITNVGSEYLVASGTTILDLGTGDFRSTFGRIINVNRSNIIGSIGTLIVTESSAYPRSWRDLIDNNTVNVEVERVLDNIYIQVGPDGEHMKNEDYEVELDSIKTFSLSVVSNFKYIVQTYGYIKVYPDEPHFDGCPSSNLLDRIEVFNEYNSKKHYEFALARLDENEGMGESYIEIRSGSLVRKITPKIVGPTKEHDYLFYWPDDEGDPVTKPNIIRIYNNGTVVDSTKKFLYKSSTTPKIEASGLSFSETTDSYFYNDMGGWYGYHESGGTVSVPNSRSLSYSKYPMKSFGYIRETSQDYSDLEKIISTGEISYLEYPFYMKGKEHFLWCVDTLDGFSSISDPTFPSGSTTVDSRYDMVLDADGESGKTIYVISRYDINNRTFITEYPEETEFKIKRDELEANIKISPQQSIGLDERSQIEYAIPIQVSCNVENNKGNIFLGSLEYKAKTEITEDSLTDVIEADDNIIEKEGIDASYISSYITSNKIQNLSVMIFQLGTDKTVFDIYSGISDLGIWATSNYIVPEIGSDYTITSFEVTKGVYPYGGEDIVTVTSEWDPKYFLVKVDSLERVRDNGSDFYWYNYLPTSLIHDTKYTLSFNIQATKVGQEGSTTISLPSIEFKKYGCNYGLYVEGKYGFGCTPEDYLGKFDSSAYVNVDNEGGAILIHAGIFYAVDGVDSTEALKVPAKYEFIGENQPIEFSWVDGNKDDDGNLRIVLPPRTRDEVGDKEYIMKVTQPHEYYPLKLYVSFYQSSLRDSSLDTEKQDYRLMFLDNEVNILSNGTVFGHEDGKFKFVSNLPESEFNKVTFRWRQKSEESFIPVDPDSLHIIEVERSYKENYVKFKFNPNGTDTFIDAYIQACYGEDNQVIGKVSAKQGYFCLITEYYNPKIYYYSSSGQHDYTPHKNPMSRLSPSTNWLYSYQQGHGTLSSKFAVTPCKSNNDNADSSIINGRGVYKLTAKKKEYYDSMEDTLEFEKIFNNAEVIFISPKTILESYSLDFVSSSTDDHDAKINPRFSDQDISYATNYNFKQYNPYLEFSYIIKDEYLRSDNIITTSGKITLKHPDTGELVNFYILSSTETYGSNQPQDINLLKFSNDTINFSYLGGSKQVSFSPASFASMFRLTLSQDGSWLTCNYQEGSDYITLTASENKTTEDESAYFRSGQLQIDVIDPRDDYVIGSYYVEVNQDPDISQTASTTSEMNVKVINPVETEVKGTVSAKIVEPVEAKITDTVNVEVGNTVQSEVVNTPNVTVTNIPTDYATSSDVSTAKNEILNAMPSIPTDYATSGELSSAVSDIISAMPSCKYTPPTDNSGDGTSGS